MNVLVEMYVELLLHHCCVVVLLGGAVKMSYDFWRKLTALIGPLISHLLPKLGIKNFQQYPRFVNKDPSLTPVFS